MAQILRYRENGVSKIRQGIMATDQSIDTDEIACFDTDGYTRKGDNVAGYRFAGIAKHNAGATGEDSHVELEAGKPFEYPTAAAAQTDIGNMVYFSGSSALSKTVGNGIIAGEIIDVVVGVSWLIDPVVTGPQTISGDMSRDAVDLAVRPTTAGDAIQTDDPAVVAQAMELNDNIMEAKGTDANIPLALKPKGTESVDVYGGKVYAEGAGADVDLDLQAKGAGIPKAGGKRIVTCAVLIAQETTDASGEIAVADMTADGVVFATFAEDPGSNKAISDVICEAGKVTVYATTGAARAALASKKVNLFVFSL
ncbi:MAG: hypothetical protein C4574_00630 [Candidatus Latescibacterota bacterium]|jgi:hypothetical protein|nr:MAG: hypothetical protein C4574_00630 [Candidatus Latescibacterota bacterium]